MRARVCVYNLSWETDVRTTFEMYLRSASRVCHTSRPNSLTVSVSKQTLKKKCSSKQELKKKKKAAVFMLSEYTHTFEWVCYIR